MCVRACVGAWVRACVRAWVRARARACVCACVCARARARACVTGFVIVYRFCHSNLETIGVAVSHTGLLGPWNLLAKNSVLKNPDGTAHHCEE